MKIFKSIQSFVAWRNSQHNNSIGFVPTMGALHQGHLSLVEKSVNKCDITIVSIFVNQLQFGLNEDLKIYPQNIKQDLRSLENYKVDAVFIPKTEQMYEQTFSCNVSESVLSKKLEGQSRPHFFDGVATIVCKLFNLVRPRYVFFGAKDVQQLYIIKKMIRDLNYNIKMIACPTIREENGLAMSSRNQYLSNIEKNEAAIIYQTLQMGKKMIKNKTSTINEIKLNMKNKLLAHNFKIDYLSIADLNDFSEIKKYTKSKIVVSVAVFYKNVRLIDNLII